MQHGDGKAKKYFPVIPDRKEELKEEKGNWREKSRMQKEARKEEETVGCRVVKMNNLEMACRNSVTCCK
jgi:hypothetical protein